MQKNHTEDERSLGDRRRRFLDTELAQDTEGISAWCVQSAFDVCKCSSSSGNLICVCLSELFQDLSQLQEIWIAEGKKERAKKAKQTLLKLATTKGTCYK